MSFWAAARIGLVLGSLAASPARAESVTVDHSLTPRLRQVTATNTGNNQLLYFTSLSLTTDDRRLVFISDRTGNPNLFTRNLAAGTERQLTTNTQGILRSYVYFDGQPNVGFGKGSVSLDPRHAVVYYIQGLQVCAVTLSGQIRVLAELPAGQVTAFTHVSADGTRLCVPTTDARALEGYHQVAGKSNFDIDARVRAENLSSWLRLYDTRSGALLACEPVPRGWVTHVQFSPVKDRLILYNHEYADEAGVERIWLWDGTRHVRLRTEGGGRSRNDWTCHEMWERDGQAVIYHGTYTNGVSYIGRVRVDGSERVEIPFPTRWTRYGHFTVGDPGELVTDGYYLAPDNPPNWAGAWISLLKVDWDHAHIQWFPLLRHGTSWTSQDAHPHPVFSHAAAAVWFTSDSTGQREVYRLGWQ